MFRRFTICFWCHDAIRNCHNLSQIWQRSYKKLLPKALNNQENAGSWQSDKCINLHTLSKICYEIISYSTGRVFKHGGLDIFFRRVRWIFCTAFQNTIKSYQHYWFIDRLQKYWSNNFFPVKPPQEEVDQYLKFLWKENLM